VRLIYKMISTLLGWIVLRARSDTSKEIEILILRHQLTVLQPRPSRLRLSWADRAVIAALSRLPPVRRLGLLVTPATILRWHRQLIAAAGPPSPPDPADRPSPPAYVAWSSAWRPKPDLGIPTDPRRTLRSRRPDWRLNSPGPGQAPPGS
jgi:hypothetical protein